MSKQTVADLIRFIDNEWTSIDQALRHIAQTNETNAAEIEASPEDQGAVVRVLRESARSWEAKADRLRDLYEELSDSDQEWLDDHARGWPA